MVDKCDLEIGNRRWTFYINPLYKDLFLPTSEDLASRDFPKQWYGLDTEQNSEENVKSQAQPSNEANVSPS